MNRFRCVVDDIGDDQKSIWFAKWGRWFYREV